MQQRWLVERSDLPNLELWSVSIDLGTHTHQVCLCKDETMAEYIAHLHNASLGQPVR